MENEHTPRPWHITTDTPIQPHHWVNQPIDILVATDKGIPERVSVDAEVLGPLAIFPDTPMTIRKPDYWSLTHIPTGRQVFWSPSYHQIREVAEALVICGIPWDNIKHTGVDENTPGYAAAKQLLQSAMAARFMRIDEQPEPKARVAYE